MAHPSTDRDGTASVVAKLLVSAALIIVGIVLIATTTSITIADGIFIGSIALALAVYLWPGVSRGQARFISFVLLLVATYALLRGFGVLELAIIRRIGGIVAIVSGGILAVPFVRLLLRERPTPSGASLPPVPKKN